jgi:hypothetical protein
MRDFIKKLLREGFNITNKTKDILDDITDEKIGEEEYQEWNYTDEIGGRAFGIMKIKDGKKIASIINMKSQPDDYFGGEKFKRRGFLRTLIKTLKDNGVDSISITLQSSDSRKALNRLVDDDTLKNPRLFTGVSTDEHPTLFDI